MSAKNQRPLVLRRQRGVALLMVLGLLALVGSVVADFQFTSRVDIQLAYNARDELQAEYNALSALRFRALLLKQSRMVQALFTGLTSGGGGAAGAAGVAGGGGAGNSAGIAIGQILELIPVECGLMSAIIKNLDKTLDGADAKEDFFPGECMATSENEHSKIAINQLANTGEGRAQIVLNMMIQLLSDARLRKHFEQDDKNGQHADSPTELVGAIADWIDADHTQVGTLGDEDRLYQYAGKDPYRAKNAPFDSVAELQLVYGVDDGLYNLLKDHVTIYNAEPAIELSTAPPDRIAMAMMSVFPVGTDPATMAQGIQAVLQMVMLARAAFMPVTVSTIQQALQGTKGIDATMLSKVFKDGSSVTWHTINAEGQMGRATRKIRAVFQATEGSFYYMRVE